jgi:hypothetical protein
VQEDSNLDVVRCNINYRAFSCDDQPETADDQLDLSGDSAISTNSAVSSGIENPHDAVNIIFLDYFYICMKTKFACNIFSGTL